MKEKYVPVLVVGYNRPGHLSRCLESLSLNPQFSKHQIFIYLDGPLNNDVLSACLETKLVAQEFSIQNANVAVRSKSRNSGLGEFILSAIDEVLADSNEVIVVEDDLILNSHFLEFCSWGLKEYVHDLSVGSISGFSLPIHINQSNYFIRGADCWGWATWKDRWIDFERDGQALLDELRKRRLQRVFDLDYSYQYTHMLERQVEGQTNSWAIRWHAHNFLRNRLVLYPSESLVINTGNDGSGTNMGNTDVYNTRMTQKRPILERVDVAENLLARQKLIDYFRRQFATRLKTKVLFSFKRFFYSDKFSL